MRHQNHMFKILINIFVALSFLSGNPVQSQTSVRSIKLTEVKVGDKVPDFSFEQILNDRSERSHLGKLTGKIIILDYWNTFCKSCIERFPEMSRMQKEFENQIQIILVNPEETGEQVKERLKIKNFSEIIPSNLPVILDAKELFQLFPAKGEIGYHIWIDANRIMKLRGNGDLNTYPEKIELMLEGKPVISVSDEGIPAYEQNKSFVFSPDRTQDINPAYSSVITRFNDKLAAYYGAISLNKKDSVAGTIRSSWLNYNVIDLYQTASRLMLADQRVLWGNLILTDVKDISRYTDRGPWYMGRVIDSNYLKSKYCYEQIVPIETTDSTRLQYMFEDLNRYFSNTYGAKIRVETRSLPCYILIRTSSIDKIKNKGEQGYLTTVENGKKILNYRGYDLKRVFQLISFAGKNAFNMYYDTILIDETNYLDKVDLKIPNPNEYKLSVEQLKYALHKYDLDIISGVRQFVVLIISENK